MFNRRAIEDIKAWYQQNKRKPLVTRGGAGQVGKTTAVRLAAEELSFKGLFIRHLPAYLNLLSFSKFSMNDAPGYLA